MKKFTVVLLGLISFLPISIYATSINPDANLTFNNITSNSIQVQYTPITQDQNLYVQQKQPLQIKYRKSDTCDNYGNGICTTSTLPETILSFYYSSDIQNPLPIIINNLQPNTKYRFWVGKNGASISNCPPTAACTTPIVWSDYSFSTQTKEALIGDRHDGVLTYKLYKGISSEQVRVLQLFLINNGYLEGTADGRFGTKTHNAVKKFQLLQGLNSDGVVGINTRTIINNFLSF